MTTYVEMFPEVRKGSAVAKLFLYYKLCRANVRAKVMGLKITQVDREVENQLLRDETRKYLNLMERYHNGITSGQTN
jgi:aminoglycoside phosphotransferase family enzyme